MKPFMAVILRALSRRNLFSGVFYVLLGVEWAKNKIGSSDTKEGKLLSKRWFSVFQVLIEWIDIIQDRGREMAWHRR